MPHAYGVLRFTVFAACALGRAAMTAASVLTPSAGPSAFAGARR
jgi:hypothetical protein